MLCHKFNGEPWRESNRFLSDIQWEKNQNQLHEGTLYQASHNKATKLVYLSNQIQLHAKAPRINTQYAVNPSLLPIS